MIRRRLLNWAAAFVDWAVGPVLVIVIVFFLGVIAGVFAS